MGGLTEKPTFFGFIFTLWNRIEFFTKPKSFGLMLSLLSDHVQRNTIEKRFSDFNKMKFY